MPTYVEVWGYGNDGVVENGAYDVKRDKDKNEIFIYYTQQTHPLEYLGDVIYDADYGEIMDRFDETGHIEGKNLIKTRKKPVEKDWGDEPPF